MVASGSRRRSAASASRQPVRKVMGGSPTSSVNRRASAARETPISAASDGDGPRLGRVVVEHAHGLPDHRVALRAVPAREVRPRAGRTTRAAPRRAAGRAAGRARRSGRVVADDLVGEHRDEGRVPHVRAEDDHRRQGVQQPLAHLGLRSRRCRPASPRSPQGRCPTTARRGASPGEGPRRRASCSAGRGG